MSRPEDDQPKHPSEPGEFTRMFVAPKPAQPAPAPPSFSQQPGVQQPNFEQPAAYSQPNAPMQGGSPQSLAPRPENSHQCS